MTQDASSNGGRISKAVSNATTPRYSLIYFIFMVVAVIIFIILETDLISELPGLLKITLYVVFLVLSSFLGTGFTKVLTTTIKDIEDILKDAKLNTGQKLNEILNVIMRCSYLAGKYFEVLNLEQFPDKEEK